MNDSYAIIFQKIPKIMETAAGKETKRTYKKSASPCEPPHIEAVTHFYIPYNYFTAPFTTPFRICFWQIM